MPFKYSVFEVPKLVSTKTLLLEHHCCHQGYCVLLGGGQTSRDVAGISLNFPELP